MASSPEAPTPPTPRSQPAAPSRGPRGSQADWPSPAPYLLNPQLQKRHPRSSQYLPCFSPKLLSGSRGALACHTVPWHSLHVSPTGCQSVVPSSSLSQPLSTPCSGRAGCPGLGAVPGAQKVCAGGLRAPCHLSDCHSPTRSWVHHPPSCLSAASSSSQGCSAAPPAAPPAALLHLTQEGGCPGTWRGSHSTPGVKGPVWNVQPCLAPRLLW